MARKGLPRTVASGESQRNVKNSHRGVYDSGGACMGPWRGGGGVGGGALARWGVGEGVRMMGAGEGLGGRGQSHGGRLVEGRLALLWIGARGFATCQL